jgi:hypothetical protein
MSTPTRPATRAGALLLLLALTAGGCRDADDRTAAPAPSTSESSSPAAKPVRTRTTLGTVTGRLARKDRLRVVAAAGDAVDSWFDAAYVGKPRPRVGNAFAGFTVGNAFAGFTPGLRAEAHADRALLTNQALARQVDTVTATRRQVRVDVLAVRGRAAGVTARFVLDLTTTGKVERTIAVRGRLLLTPTGHGWKVFGYDVSRGDPPRHEKPARSGKKKGGGR